jgi:hypothetical protein
MAASLFSTPRPSRNSNGMGIVESQQRAGLSWPERNAAQQLPVNPKEDCLAIDHCSDSEARLRQSVDTDRSSRNRCG